MSLTRMLFEVPERLCDGLSMLSGYNVSLNGESAYMGMKHTYSLQEAMPEPIFDMESFMLSF